MDEYCERKSQLNLSNFRENLKTYKKPHPCQNGAFFIFKDNYFLSFTPNAPLIIPRRIANTIPDIQFEISNPDTRFAVRRIIRNPIIAPTRPNVTKFTGIARNLNTAQSVALTRASTTATIIAVHSQLIDTPGVIYAATKTANPDTNKLIRNHIATIGYDIKPT